MAKSIEGEFKWEDFRKNFFEGSFYEFRYKYWYIDILQKAKGIFKKKINGFLFYTNMIIMEITFIQNIERQSFYWKTLT